VRVVWRDVWWREVTGKVRIVALATQGEPLLLVSTDLTRPPAVMIQLDAARLPLALPLRDLQQDGGLGDYQCYTLLAIHRFMHLTLAAFCLWRLTMRRDQRAPWVAATGPNPTGELTPLSCQRLHRALRRFVLQRIFAASAPAADWHNTEGTYEQIFRIAACHHHLTRIPRSAAGTKNAKV
jgi:hypothetical protein